MKHQTYVVLTALVLAVWLIVVPLSTAGSADPSWRGWTYSDQPPAHPQPGDGWLPTSHQNLRYWTGTHWEPVGGKWYKIASYTDDDFPQEGVVLWVEPGMPQALGFETWQAMADDVASPDGVISEIGLKYVSNFGSEKSNWFESFPANGLAPEGYPYITRKEKWFYFSTDRTAGVVNPLARVAAQADIRIGNHGTENLMYLRLQGTQEAQYKLPGQSGPTSPVLRPAIGFDGAYDITLAVYVKI